MKTLLTILFFLQVTLAFPCTTFVLKNNQHYLFGRNLDWVSDNGVVVVNKRNIQKQSLVFPPNKPTKWVSKYGSITFNQFGKEFPYGGMNEKGLVVEIMKVYGSYPSADDRTVVNELQWVQYQLDNAQTVEEVLASDKKIRISKVSQNLHFLVSDKAGNVAVIEFSKKGMISYTGEQLAFPVLENDMYAVSQKKHKRGQSCRFNTAINMLEAYNSKEPATPYAFKILDKVALDGSWSIVYDIRNMSVHFKTASYQTLRTFSFDSFDFTCQTPALLYDMERQDKGAIDKQFVSFSHKLNKRKFDAGIKSNRITLPAQYLKPFYTYNQTCFCTQ